MTSALSVVHHSGAPVPNGERVFPQLHGVPACVMQNCETPTKSESHLGGKRENRIKTSYPGAGITLASGTTGAAGQGKTVVGLSRFLGNQDAATIRRICERTHDKCGQRLPPARHFFARRTGPFCIGLDRTPKRPLGGAACVSFALEANRRVPTWPEKCRERNKGWPLLPTLASRL